MPETNGIEAIQKLRATNEFRIAPVIELSAGVDLMSVKESLNDEQLA